MEAPGEILRNVAIFGGLSDETLEFLHERLQRVAARAGQTFFRQGEMGGAVYVLEEGRVEVVRSRDEKSVVLASFEPGACFGEIALVAICPRSATVRAVTDCCAVRLEHKALLELYQRDLEQFTLVQMNLGREIARRLNETSEMLFEHTLALAERDAKVAGLLAFALK